MVGSPEAWIDVNAAALIFHLEVAKLDNSHLERVLEDLDLKCEKVWIGCSRYQKPKA